MTHEQAVEKHAAERYLLDDMPELERFAFEEHLFDCRICAEDVRTGALMQEGVKTGLLPPGVGSRESGVTLQDPKTPRLQDLTSRRRIRSGAGPVRRLRRQHVRPRRPSRSGRLPSASSR